MKYLIRTVLVVISCALAYLTYEQIAEPVRYAKEVIEKEQAVIDRLKVIRDGQIVFKDEKGRFTASFDTLIDFMKNGKMKMLVEYGDIDDTTTVFRSVEKMVSIKDTLFKNINLDEIRFVPFNDTLQFIMQANTITKNNVSVPVFQVTDPKPFDRERVKKKDPLRVGSVFEVDYNGNWGSR